ncbi:dual specificity protein phosphatase 13A-like [Rhinoderma darwinii]|uniref:dual specificity protein phosphatase 13A-like n=1 Tax=Rhinoderma darwinii TaxID=43563 RepID=UPI003F66397E
MSTSSFLSSFSRRLFRSTEKIDPNERTSKSTHEDNECGIKDEQTSLTQRPSVVNLQRLLAQTQTSGNLRKQIWCNGSLEHNFDSTANRRSVCSREEIDIYLRTCKSKYQEKELYIKDEHCGPQYSVIKLQKLLGQPQIPKNHMDQILSNVFLGDKTVAGNLKLLNNLHISHVLNAAEGDEQNHVTSKTYSGTDIKYLGFKVLDDPSFNITPLLQPGAMFIEQGVSFSGKVLVFCTKGVSRAAAFVIAYLMFYQNLQLEDAIQCIIKQRSIYPNSGFLSQLQDLDKKLFL